LNGEGKIPLVVEDRMLSIYDFIRQFPALFRKAFVAAKNKRTVRVVFRVVAAIALVPLVFGLFTAFYGRLVRRDRVFGVATDTRNWHSHGAGRANARAHGDVRAARTRAGGAGRWVRAGSGDCGGAADDIAAVPRQLCRSADVRPRVPRAGRHGGASQLPTVAARGSGGPSRSLARRIATSENASSE
jgi:hypothetical protein